MMHVLPINRAFWCYLSHLSLGVFVKRFTSVVLLTWLPLLLDCMWGCRNSGSSALHGQRDGMPTPQRAGEVPPYSELMGLEPVPVNEAVCFVPMNRSKTNVHEKDTERERESVCVCVCVREREREKDGN